MKQDFDRLIPEQRGVILVASEATYKSLCTSLAKLRIAVAAGAGAGALLTVLLPPLGLPMLAGTVTLQVALIAVASSVAMSKTAFKDSLMRNEIPIPHLDIVEAAKRFRFDHGHPQDGAAYVLDSVMGDYYLMPSLADERHAQEKVAAFQELVSALGAKKLELFSGEVEEKKGKGEVSLKHAAAQAGINAAFEATGEVKRGVYAEFGKPRRKPFVPDGITRWLDSDPTMRSMASSRIDGSVERLRVSLVVDAAQMANGKLLLGLAAFKLNVGGEYRQVQRTTWSFDVEFWPNE